MWTTHEGGRIRVLTLLTHPARQEPLHLECFDVRFAHGNAVADETALQYRLLREQNAGVIKIRCETVDGGE